MKLLYPPFARKLELLVANCTARGANYFATDGFRTPAEQEALWRKGRNNAGAVVAPKAVVTKVRFGPHNCGAAADLRRDVSPNRGLQLAPDETSDLYDILAEEAVKLQLDPGHLWKSFVDHPHVQLPLAAHGLSLSNLRKTYHVDGMPGVFRALDAAGPW